MKIIILFGALFIGFIVWKYWALLIGAGYDPTPMHRVKKMLEIALTNENDIVYDLGSGDGRIIITAARSFGARAVGIEADPFRFIFSWLNVIFTGQKKKIKVCFGDFFKFDLSEATVIILFLYGPTNDRLKSKLMRELKPGSRVVSYVWQFKDWIFDECLINDDIFLYRIPEAVDNDTD
ncbi:hypothetical protein A2Y85_04380 [candidate division WOR-3 bacterium RBG_13_43_14]|uniref:Uncharacterized protein n=1 Tax=candidate division WOR-3 bacterium RBG_13_43_14 TaxID=1802590 RepID=A0A1F4UBX9_UNCW3|nr:MAG: hypothetical protein A2Y85_04380 [candidate division WOR-3 bacterium RBG_13_43_14]